jgi:hypothetical protein
MPYANPLAGRAREAGGLPYSAGVPAAGTTAVQTISSTGTPTGGTFKLKYGSQRTSALAYNASAANIQTALRALSNIGSSGVNCSGGALPTDVVVTFAGPLAKRAVKTISVVEKALTGGSSPDITVANTTPGVNSEFPGLAGVGQPVRGGDGKLYVNTGTADSPTWTVAGSQT